MTDLAERLKATDEFDLDNPWSFVDLRDAYTSLHEDTIKAADEITRLQSALSVAQAQGEVMRSALDKIANGEVPDETKREWLGLSEEAYYEAYSEWFQEQAKEALQSTPPTAVARVIEAARELEPHLDGLICYASTTSEHEPNRLVLNLRKALAGLDGGRKG